MGDPAAEQWRQGEGGGRRRQWGEAAARWRQGQEIEKRNRKKRGESTPHNICYYNS